ncbi:helix-turn-helix transcriptional regulator [Foetidibacter luteolus]|uniref:helix-turn-helix transcriptional regulator n=1 Tax=Foetidibacter luteolus TaxID=2608880 RepID=UPI00129BB40E|nr:YafY family protein [Foetidibacter luteolus]
MNRTDRLNAILVHLQSKKKVKAQEIADRFGITLRTVYRDVKALEESGVPIIGESGIGYSVMEGYRLPPVMFTQEEAAALVLSAKLSNPLPGNSGKSHLEDALFKIKSVIRGSDKDFLDELEKSVAVEMSNLPSTEKPSYVMQQLQKAMIGKYVVKMQYQSLYKKEQVWRDIEPIGLYYYSLGWHIIAWCRLRKNYRDFRIDRICQFTITDESFAAKKHQSLQEYITQTTRKTAMQEVVVRMTKKTASYVINQKYNYGFLSEEEVNANELRMYFLTYCNEHFGRWLLTFTNAVTIEQPLALKEYMYRLLDELKEKYEGSLEMA